MRQEKAGYDRLYSEEELTAFAVEIAKEEEAIIVLESEIGDKKTEIKDKRGLIKELLTKRREGFETVAKTFNIYIDQGQWQKVYVDPETDEEYKREQLPEHYQIDAEDEIINPVKEDKKNTKKKEKEEAPAEA